MANNCLQMNFFLVNFGLVPGGRTDRRTDGFLRAHCALEAVCSKIKIEIEIVFSFLLSVMKQALLPPLGASKSADLWKSLIPPDTEHGKKEA